MARIDKIQLRRDSAADWVTADPTLAAGEVGFEEDTGLIKIGDGSTAWTSLEYLLNRSYVAKTSAYTATAVDSLINCTTGTFAITVPTAVGITGKSYTIKNTGAGTITITTTSSQTIDGAAASLVSLNNGDGITITSDGANWIITGVV